MNQPGATAFTGVTVLPMTGAPPLHAQTVLVRNGRIAAIAPAASLPVPSDAAAIDGRGKFLMPGLCDMHVHMYGRRGEALSDAEMLKRSREYLYLFLCRGVTTIRNMAGIPLHLRMRAEVAEGSTIGPRIYTAGPILETRFTHKLLLGIGEEVKSPAEARAMVLANHRDGYDFIKVYNDIDADIYDTSIATAREVGLQVIGHVAFAKGLTGALAAKQDSIEHLRSYDFAADTRPSPPGKRFEGWLHTTPARMREMAERTAAAGVWNVPTLVTESGIYPDGEPAPEQDLSGLPGWFEQRMRADTMAGVFTNEQRKAIKDGAPMRQAFVAALDRAGAKLMAGTDTPVLQLVPGRSLLREIELFVEGGISNLRALQCATALPAEFLGRQDRIGTVEVGKDADLLLLNADPLADIAALRHQAGVMAAGRWLPTEALQATVAGFDLAAAAE
jgi:imidazolonepropionase-like amidohydrolase